jgi:conjugal transfer ATP-binding protein TraC
MAYEIPQELEYKEKIIFGLTFHQLIYALIFSPFVLTSLFKLPFSWPVKIAVALVPSSLACIFMFTDLPKLALNYIKWSRNREYNTEQLRDYLKLEKIENQTLTLKNKTLSIIKVEPINFAIKNEEEKGIITKTFQKFLNSLDFPIQIVVATETVNLDHYLNSIEDKSEYQELFDKFKQHMQSMTSSLLSRAFYIIIPQKNNLQIQIGVCEELLRSMNLKYKILKNQELSDALSSFFNDQYEDDKEIDKDDYLFNTVAPNKFKINPTDIELDKKIIRTIAVRGYPRTVEEGFLDKIITLNGDFDISIHIEPYPIETMMINLNRELQKQRADLWSLKNKEIINPSLEIKYKDTKQVLKHLQKGDEKLFNISLYISCKAKNKAELDLLTERVLSKLNSLLMLPYLPKYEMAKAVKSVLPFASDDLQIKRNLTTKALSAFFPFTSQFLQVDNSGIFLGLNKNGIPIIKDLFKLYNANGVVLASSGGGKSYFAKLMISRLLLNGTKVMVIDPQSEYVDLVHKFDGQLVTISKDSETIINPLDLMGHDFDEKKLTLLEILPIMIGQMSEIQKAVIDRALTSIYAAKGITNDKSTWRREPPILGDLLGELKKMSRTATQLEKETYRSLINRVEMYVTGVFGFLNKQTNLNFDKKFVTFNIGNMPSQVKPTVMFLILDYVYQKMKKDIERKILVIDEAWSLLQRTEDEGYIFRIVKTCRKFNLGLLMITQDVADLLSNKAGKALLNNSEYTLLLRQKPAIIDQVVKTFRLSSHEKERLLTASSGQGVLIISDEHSEIKVVSSPEEHSIITTNADERLKKEVSKSNEVVTEFEKCSLDFSKGIFKKSKLKKEEVEELLKCGYMLSAHVGLYGGRREEYLLKPRYNESAEHFFVTKAIEEYIRKYTDEIDLPVCSNADIIFEYKGKKIAIEVETGKKYDNDRKQLDKKLIHLNRNFGKNWFFVVTDVRRFKDKYQKLGKTVARKEVPSTIKSMIC